MTTSNNDNENKKEGEKKGHNVPMSPLGFNMVADGITEYLTSGEGVTKEKVKEGAEAIATPAPATQNEDNDEGKKGS